MVSARFDSITDLQSSQTGLRGLGLLLSLIPLLIYKALKRNWCISHGYKGLIPLLIYKALKLMFGWLVLSIV